MTIAKKVASASTSTAIQRPPDFEYLVSQPNGTRIDFRTGGVEHELLIMPRIESEPVDRASGGARSIYRHASSARQHPRVCARLSRARMVDRSRGGGSHIGPGKARGDENCEPGLIENTDELIAHV
jgi:hypothetical protein